MQRRPLPLLLLALLPLAAPAQELAESPDGWTGTGELGLAMARGNSRSESLNTRLRLAHETEGWKNSFNASALRTRAEVSGDFDGDGTPERRYQTSANRYDVAGATAYRFDPRNHLSGSARYEHNDFASYEYQGTVALGYGHRFVDNERTKFSGEIGPGYRRARLADDGEVQSSLIGRAALVVGLDSGITHLAGALARPTIGLYCDYDPRLVPVTGEAFTASLGGATTPPSPESVIEAIGQAVGA